MATYNRGQLNTLIEKRDLVALQAVADEFGLILVDYSTPADFIDEVLRIQVIEIEPELPDWLKEPDVEEIPEWMSNLSPFETRESERIKFGDEFEPESEDGNFLIWLKSLKRELADTRWPTVVEATVARVPGPVGELGQDFLRHVTPAEAAVLVGVYLLLKKYIFDEDTPSTTGEPKNPNTPAPKKAEEVKAKSKKNKRPWL